MSSSSELPPLIPPKQLPTSRIGVLFQRRTRSGRRDSDGVVTVDFGGDDVVGGQQRRRVRLRQDRRQLLDFVGEKRIVDFGDEAFQQLRRRGSCFFRQGGTAGGGGTWSSSASSSTATGVQIQRGNVVEKVEGV